METIKLNIQAYSDRQRIIEGLTNSGYHTWVEEEELTLGKNYYVCSEVKEEAK